MKKFLALIVPGLLVVPSVAHAQDLSWLNSIVTSLDAIVDLLVPLLYSLAVVAFLYGLVKYIFAAGNEESQADGRKIMIAGLIALFVAFALWGIIQLMGDTLGVDEGGVITPPTIQ